MSSITTFVAVVVSLSGAASPTRQGFGTPMLLGYHTFWNERFRLYPQSSALTQMVGEGFPTTHPMFRAMEVMCAQDPAPKLIGIGRRGLAFTQILHLRCLSTTAGDLYVVTVIGNDGVAHTYQLVSTGVPDDDAPAFAELITADAVGTITVSTDTITFTQDPGLLTDLRDWSSAFFEVEDATEDPGIADDIIAVTRENTLGWYGLCLDSNSQAEVLAAMAAIEATGQGGKFGFYSNADRKSVQSDHTDDLFSTKQSLSYIKEYTQYSGRQVLSWAGAAMAAAALARSPGSYSLAYKDLAGVLADTDASLTPTERAVLNTASTSQPGTGGKNGNWYMSVGGENVTFPGTSGKSRWCDTTIFIDWLQSNLQVDVFAVLKGNDRVGYTDMDLAKIGRAIKSRMRVASQPPFGGINPELPIVVTMPAAADITAQDKNDRNLPLPTAATATLTGAINTTTIGVQLAP